MHRLRSLRSLPLVAVVVGLFVALSGSATAAVLLTGKDIKNGSLTHADLARDTILSQDIRDGQVMRDDLSPGLQRAIMRGGQDGADGAKGANGADGANGAGTAGGQAGPRGETGAQGVAGRNGVSAGEWGATVNAWTPLTGWPGTEVAEGVITLTEARRARSSPAPPSRASSTSRRRAR